MDRGPDALSFAVVSAVSGALELRIGDGGDQLSQRPHESNVFLEVWRESRVEAARPGRGSPRAWNRPAERAVPALGSREKLESHGFLLEFLPATLVPRV